MVVENSIQGHLQAGMQISKHEDRSEGGRGWGKCFLRYLRTLQLQDLKSKLSKWFLWILNALSNHFYQSLGSQTPTWTQPNLNRAFQTFQGKEKKHLGVVFWMISWYLQVSLLFFSCFLTAVGLQFFLLPLVPTELPRLMIIACLAATWGGENKCCWRGNHSLITVAQHFKLGNLLCSKSKLITKMRVVKCQTLSFFVFIAPVLHVFPYLLTYLDLIPVAFIQAAPICSLPCCRRVGV